MNINEHIGRLRSRYGCWSGLRRRRFFKTASAGGWWKMHRKIRPHPAYLKHSASSLSLSLSLFYRSFSISAGARACDWTMDGRAECREARCSNTVVAGAAPLCQQVLMPGVIHTFTDRKISVCRPAAVPYRWSACGLRHTDRFVVHERWHYSCGILQPGIPSSIPSSTSLPWSAVRCSPFWLTNNTFHARFRAYETHTNFYLTKNGKYIDRHNCSAVLGITFCCYLLR